MARIPNAFNFRVADQTALDTSLFLHLYSPIYLLAQLKHEDFTAPKLIYLVGSPGSGKSSFLRLFETSTLIALGRNQPRNVEHTLLPTLKDLGVLSTGQPACFGIYVNCDSSLRDIENLELEGANEKLLNTLLDIRILGGFVRSIEMLNQEFSFLEDFDATQLPPLPGEEMPPQMFAIKQTLGSLKATCQQIEKDFATFLNSFPGESIPPSIQLHSRVFSISYLARIRDQSTQLRGILPIVMLDDLHELYERQRQQVNAEFLRRSVIPRWIAVRKHVYELERLISLEGQTDNREFREINLDSASLALFRRFVNNVANRRLNMSSDLQPYNVTDFEDQLEDSLTRIPTEKIKREIADLVENIRALDPTQRIAAVGMEDEIEIEELIRLQARLIFLERQRSRPQQSLFGIVVPADSDIQGKVHDAARLFAARTFKFPYYFSFDTLADCATGNVEQFLSIASPFAGKMILRAELSQDLRINPAEQQKLLRASAETYFDLIDRRFDRGYAIKQLVDNLGRFFHAVTFRPNAPIAPGVNGFGFERRHFREFMDGSNGDPEVKAFKEVLTRAVAGNVLFARETKQGQAGTQRIVFYLNRLLCVKYDLPLSLGGWQHIKPDLLLDMTKRRVGSREWGKRWVEPLLGEAEI